MPTKTRYSTATDFHLLRPGGLIAEIYAKLADKCSPFTLRPGEILVQPRGENAATAWFFTHGLFSINRRIDNLQVLVSFATPDAMSVFGLTEGLMEESLFMLKAETQCQGFSVKLSQIYNINDSVLWQKIAELLAWFVKLATIRDIQFVGTTSYSIIRTQLITLMSLPEEYRLKTNAQVFIRQRTNLSRSNILRILNELEEGEYISLQRGHLIALRYIPLNF